MLKLINDLKQKAMYIVKSINGLGYFPIVLESGFWNIENIAIVGNFMRNDAYFGDKRLNFQYREKYNDLAFSYTHDFSDNYHDAYILEKLTKF